MKNSLAPSHLAYLASCAIALGALAFAGLQPPQPWHGRVPFPSPTENRLRADAEERNKEERERWFESLHRAAPGTDWRAVEEANREVLRLERESRAGSGREELPGGVRSTQWTEVGSANLAGRTHVTAISPNDGALYIGSNLGGVWKGTIDGEGWRAIADGLGICAQGLMISPGTPEVITVTNRSGRIFATTDGGATWFVPAGLPGIIYDCKRIVRDLGSPRTIYLLTRSGIWQNGSWHYGWHINRSDDGGVTYATVHVIAAQWPQCDLWINRVQPGPLYLAIGKSLKVSNDHALTFTAVGDAPVTTNYVILQGSEAGAPTFYAAYKIGSQWKLYRSADGGMSWTFRFDINDFWETLCSSIANRDLIFFAGVESWRSTNGGLAFTKLNNWWEYYGDPVNKLHADLPGMDCLMVGGQERIFFDTDGGTYLSADGGQTVRNISLHGLNVSQYYGILTSSTSPYLVVGGSQDQGYQQSIGGQTQAPLDFNQLISGDYGHVTSTTRAHDYVYSVYPGFVLLQVNEADPQNLVQLDFPPSGSWSWMPFILADPQNPDIFYFCADHLWKYVRTGGVSYTSTQLPQSFAPNYLSGLAISKADSNYWFAVTDVGRLWYSHDAGATWTISSSQGPAEHYFYGTAIIASPTDRDIAYVGGSGYSGPAVYSTTDGGVTWLPMGNGLPNTLVFGLAFDNDTDQNLYAAAEAGPYAYDAATDVWSSILGAEGPLSSYWCIESVPEIGVVRFGTYGRGIWDYRVLSPGDVADRTPRDTGISLTAYPSPARDRITFSFDMATAGRVRLDLFDVAGRRVSTLCDEMRGGGRQEIRAGLVAEGGRPIESGVYLARLTTPSGTRVGKVHVSR